METPYNAYIVFMLFLNIELSIYSYAFTIFQNFYTVGNICLILNAHCTFTHEGNVMLQPEGSQRCDVTLDLFFMATGRHINIFFTKALTIDYS